MRNRFSRSFLRECSDRMRPLPLCLLVALLPSATAAFSDLEALQKHADVLIREGKKREAVRLLQEGLRQDPNWQAGLWGLGSVFYQESRYPVARQALERLVQLDPKSGAAWALLGMSEFKMHDYRMAVEHIQRGLSVGIPVALGLTEPAYYHYAMSLLATGSVDRALTIFQGLSRRQAVYGKEWTIALGLVTLHLPVLPEVAIQTLPPERLAVINRVGELQLESDQLGPEDLRRRWEELVNANPAVPNLRLAFGRLLLLQFNDTSAAEREFRQELKNNPTDVTTSLWLAHNLMVQENLEEAKTVARAALVLDPHSASLHHLMGALLRRQGKYEEARQELETSLAQDPAQSRARYLLSQVYRELGRRDDANWELSLFRKLKEAENSFRDTGRLPAAVYEAQADK
ncbi:MAG: tetratricopeptide repeat protein [Acidobacteriota bacterium]